MLVYSVVGRESGHMRRAKARCLLKTLAFLRGKPRPADQVEDFPWARSCFAALIAFRSARNAAACRLNSAR